jgi:hypothetical protein
MVLIPKSPPHDKGHFHRIIEIGKKKMPDPDAKNQVIWGLVSGVGNDKGAFKDSFGAYSYETKTRGEHSPAPNPRVGERDRVREGEQAMNRTPKDEVKCNVRGRDRRTMKGKTKRRRRAHPDAKERG